MGIYLLIILFCDHVHTLLTYMKIPVTCYVIWTCKFITCKFANYHTSVLIYWKLCCTINVKVKSEGKIVPVLN
jgi:hypothetical protein